MIFYISATELINIFYINRTKMNAQLDSTLLLYFYTISDSQQLIQSHQQQLLIHPCFNPYELYKHIANSSSVLTRKTLMNYLSQKNFDPSAVEFYLTRHSFTAEFISFEGFVGSLVPYTPNVNRESAKNIVVQSNNNKLKQAVLALYHKLICVEIKAIERLLLIYSQINLNWLELKVKMCRDLLKAKGHYQQSESIEIFREWMEWYSGFQFHQMLNILRWLGGINDQDIERGLVFKCKRRFSRSKSKKSDSFSKGQTSRKSSFKNIPIINQTPTSLKNTAVVQNINAHNEVIKSFCYCLKTIIMLQHKLNVILQKVSLSKAKQILSPLLVLKIIPINTLIDFICSKTNLSLQLVSSFKQALKQLTLTSTELQSTLLSDKVKEQKEEGDCKKVVCQALLTACTLKAVIIGEVSKIKDNTHSLFKMLCPKASSIPAKDMSMVLMQLEVPCNASELEKIMFMFGDGKYIQENKFCGWFTKQLDNLHLRVLF